MLHSIGVLKVSTLNCLLFTHSEGESVLFARKKEKKHERAVKLRKPNCVLSALSNKFLPLNVSCSEGCLSSLYILFTTPRGKYLPTQMHFIFFVNGTAQNSPELKRSKSAHYFISHACRNGTITMAYLGCD